jgi:hypothetical protein
MYYVQGLEAAAAFVVGGVLWVGSVLWVVVLAVAVEVVPVLVEAEAVQRQRVWLAMKWV